MELEAVYKSIPSFTKWYLACFIINTWLISGDIVEYSTLELDFAKVLKGFEIWRPFTCFAFWKGFSFLFVLLIVISHVLLSTIEQYYKRRVYDFYYMLCFIWCCHTILGYILETYQDMMTELLWSLVYVYWRREAEDQVQIFGIMIKNKYFPWVWVVIWKLTGYQVIKIIAGYTIGHLYDYLKFIMPDSIGYNLLETPEFFKWFVSFIAKKLFINRKPHQQQANEVWITNFQQILEN
jgi:Derlin-1